MFQLHHTKHHASNSPHSRWLPSKWTQFLALALALPGLAGWAASPGYTSSRSAPSRSAAFGQITPQGVNVWSSNGPGDAVFSLAVDPGDPNIIYAGSRSGVGKSTDAGASWRNTALPIEAKGISITVALVIDFANPNIVYAGIAEPSGCHFMDRRLFKSTDGGTSWSDSISPPINGCDNIHSLVIDPTNPTTLYLADYDDSVGDTAYPLVKTTDGGVTWRSSLATVVPAFTVVAIDPRNPSTVYGGTFDFGYFGFGTGVLKSTDGGAHWSTTGLRNAGVSALAIDPLNPSILYAATSSFEGYPSHPRDFHGLFKSTDSGVSWFAINIGLSDLIGTSSSIVALAIHPNNADILFAGTSGRGVFKSIDAGVTWSPFSDGLTDLDVKTLAIAPGNPSTLYAGTSGGLFKITDIPIPRITNASVTGKKLFVVGENFDAGAVILLNGEEQKTRNDDQNPVTTLIGKRAGNKIKVGDKLQVRNPNGSLSQEFVFTGT